MSTATSKTKKAAKPEGEKFSRKQRLLAPARNQEERVRQFAEEYTSPELAAFRVVQVAERELLRWLKPYLQSKRRHGA